MGLNIPEVLTANTAGSIMTLFLLLVRVRRYEREHTAERLFNAMLVATLMALVSETVSFLADGKVFPGSIFLLFLSNTVCTGLTVTMGFLWCMFVNSYIYRSAPRLAKRAAELGVPLAAAYLLLIINLFGNGIVFSIAENGTYSRGPLSIIIYIVLFIYFVESVGEVYVSKKRGVPMVFFPVACFVIPCGIGTVIQGLFYGLATGWLATAIACVFVSMEMQTKDSFIDATSGLFNRKYMNYYLNKAAHSGDSLYGIMMDINDFKLINDCFGHTVGDCAISEMGKILSRSISESAAAMRMSGDEFVVFISNGSEQELEAYRLRIEANLRRFNESDSVPYQLTVSIGTASLSGKTVEQFLGEMDRAMYEAKQVYHKGRYRSPECSE